MNRTAAVCLLVMCLVWSAVAQAQVAVGVPGTADRPVSLIADRIDFDPTTGILRAEGNVQIFRGTEVLSTQSLVYDQRNGSLTIPGALVLADGTELVARAKSAQIDGDLQNGLIQGAEVLIAQQLQLSARKFHLQNGNFKVLDNVVATACHVCSANPVPFWKIRARRVVHDEEARRLYFEEAAVDFLGVPIFYAPRLRVPDPTVQRATGFLVPKFSTSTVLGYGVEVPFYVTLGDHADFTVTPKVFSKGSALIGLQYRRQMANGGFVIDGHFTLSDDLAPRSTRSSLSAVGKFFLPNEIELDFGVEVASDKSVRDDYAIGVDGEDRLISFVTLSRTRRNSYASVSTRYTQSLRTNEIDQEIPLVLPEVFARKTWADPYLGGKFGLTVQSATLLRENDSRFTRIGLAADWTADWIMPSGLIVGAYAGVSGNSYYLENYPNFDDGTIAEVVPTAAVDLRMPFSRQAGRVTHLIEPRIQVVWAPDSTRANPNEDSTQLEFEETNLFSLNRFPGFDRSERGLRANIGLTYKRIDPLGWSFGVTAGRVVRENDLGQFGAGTGLDGRSSDFVTTLSFSYKDQIDFINRTLYDDDFSVSKNEARLGLNYDSLRLETSYVWLEQNVVAGASDRTHEAALALAYRRNDYWTYLGEWRQNLETGSATSGKFGIRYENECVAINLSYSLQFEGSGIVRPNRELGLTVELAGLGNKKRNKRYANRCTALRTGAMGQI